MISRLSLRPFATLALLGILLTGCTANPSANTSNSTSSASNVTSDSGFTIVRLEYGGEDTWNYTVRGDVPTPCHSFTVDAVVRESFPEQVTLDVTVKTPTTDIACAQVITTKEVAGVFTASSEASTSIRVIK